MSKVLWLPSALRAEGATVKVVAGWQDRGRPASTGGFDPYATGWHHTGTKTSMANPCPTLHTCIVGRPDLAGPLCAALIGYDGIIHVIAAGRANHAGKSNGVGPLFVGDGNTQMVGFEIDYDGTQAMSPQQYEASIMAGAACERHFGHGENYCLGHKEWSVTGKWDPGGYNMNSMRADVGARLQSSPGGGTSGGDEDDVTKYVSLSGPGFVMKNGADWTPCKLDTENSDQNDVHSGEYAWLYLSDSYYQAMTVLGSVKASTPDTTLMVRWAEYDSGGNYKSSAGTTEYPLTSGSTSVKDQTTDLCAAKNKVRCEVKPVGGDIEIASVGVRALFWPR